MRQREKKNSKGRRERRQKERKNIVLFLFSKECTEDVQKHEGNNWQRFGSIFWISVKAAFVSTKIHSISGDALGQS